MYNLKTWLYGAMFTGLLIVAMTITGCNQSAPSAPSPIPATASATLTSTPPPTSTPQDTATPTAVLPTPTPTPNLTATAAACQPAAQVTEARLPERAQLRPGETFTQTWRLSSSGNCTFHRLALAPLAPIQMPTGLGIVLALRMVSGI
jgi:cytoskeletal protein RodZ